MRTLWIAAVVSDIGTWVQLIVVGSLVARNTGSAVQTGLVALATFLPQSFASPIGGLLADRHDRRKVFALALLVQALATGVLAVVLGFGVQQPGVLTAIIMLSASAGAVGQPSYTAIQPDLVEGDELMAMISLVTLSWNGGRIAGPILGSLLVTVTGPAEVVGLNALSFLVLAAALTRLDGSFRSTTPDTGGVGERLRTGWTAMATTPGVAYGLAAAIGLNVLVIPFMGLIPIYARSEFGGGTGLAGAIASAQGIGAVLGSIGVSSLAARMRRSTLFSGQIVALCVVLVLYGLAPTPALVIVVASVLGAVSAATIITMVSTAQRDAPPDTRGRVLSLFQAINGLMYGVGLLTIGFLGDILNLRIAFVIGAVVNLSYSAVLALRLPRWRSAFDGDAATSPDAPVINE